MIWDGFVLGGIHQWSLRFAFLQFILLFLQFVQIFVVLEINMIWMNVFLVLELGYGMDGCECHLKSFVLFTGSSLPGQLMKCHHI